MRCAHLNSSSQEIDPRVGLPKLRAPWVERRLAAGDKVVTQMHYARAGVVTEEMAFVAAREELDPEFVRSEVLLHPTFAKGLGTCRCQLGISIIKQISEEAFELTLRDWGLNVGLRRRQARSVTDESSSCSDALTSGCGACTRRMHPPPACYRGCDLRKTL